MYHCLCWRILYVRSDFSASQWDIFCIFQYKEMIIRMNNLLDDINYNVEKVPLPRWVKYTFSIALCFIAPTTLIMNTMTASQFRNRTNLPSDLIVGVFVVGIVLLLVSVAVFIHNRYKNRKITK